MPITFQFIINVLFILVTFIALVQFIVAWQMDELNDANWTPDVVALVRNIRILMFASLGVIWAFTAVTLAIWPVLVHIPKLTNNVASPPLVATGLALLMAQVWILEGARKTYGLRVFLTGATICCGTMIFSAFAMLMDVRETLG